MRDFEQMVNECFSNTMLLRDVKADKRSIEHIYDVLRRNIDNLVSFPLQMGLDEDGRNNIIYAIVALADELALKGNDTLVDFWMPKLLQMHYFQENAAGENFFRRLNVLMHRSSVNPMVIQSFYTAMALGFEGQYGILGRDSELQRLLKTVHQSFHDPKWVEHRLLTPYPHATLESSAKSREPIFNIRQIYIATTIVFLFWVTCFFSTRIYLSSHAQRIAAKAEVLSKGR